MSIKHEFAIKHNGKTLGIKDATQLRRLVDSGQIKENDKVYLLADKRWVNLDEIPGLAEEHKPAPPIEEQAPQFDGQPTSNESSFQTKEFAALIKELDAPETMQRLTSKVSDSDQQSVLIEATKTIHKMHTAETKRASQRAETMVAAKVPNPERNWQMTRVATLFAVCALVLGLAMGFFGTTWAVNEGVFGLDNQILQAQTGSPDESIKNP